MPYKDEYYERPSGRSPISDFVDGLQLKERAVVMSKMDMLRKEGFLLISIETLKPLIDFKKKEEVDKGLYELVAGSIRIGTYFHRVRNTFVYLWGWRKGRQVQSSDVDKCRRLLHEYLKERQE